MPSCTKDFDTINEDPNTPVVVPTSFILTDAQRELGDKLWDEWWSGRFGMVYSQYWSQTAYSEESRFQPRTNITNSYWSEFYTALMNFEKIIELNTNEDTKGVASQSGANENQIAICRIMKAYTFNMMTDVWGDIPYAEALKGIENSTPAYSKQKDIYDDLLKELSEAQGQITMDGVAIQGDLVYGGDMALWKKFANSLRMRIALRAMKQDASYQSHIVSAISDGPFDSFTDDATLVFDVNAPSYNPIYESYSIEGRTDFACSNTLMDMLNGSGDPRVSFFADASVNDGTYTGLGYGLNASNAAAAAGPDGTSVSLPNSSYVRGADSPAIFMTYSEVCFIKAELGLGSGTQAEYENGITASMNQWGVDLASITSYMATVPAADATTIGNEKWLALYPQGLQGWFEWRRSGFPVLNECADGVIFDQGDRTAPARLFYPTDEQVKNEASYNAAVSAQGTDVLGTRVWWDK